MTDTIPNDVYEAAAPPPDTGDRNGRAPTAPLGADEHVAVERRALATILQNPAEVVDLLDRLHPESFRGPNHRLIAQAIHDVHLRGDPVDIHAVSRDLVAVADHVTPTLREVAGHADASGAVGRLAHHLELVDGYAAEFDLGMSVRQARDLLDTGSAGAAARLLADAVEQYGTHRTGGADRRAIRGGEAILDQPDDIPTIWGDGGEVLWAAGEPAMIAAPPGVGKTTLGQQVVLGLIGLRDTVLGFPVTDSHRRVLYLAMDRPRQIRRSFRRMVDESHRDVLDDRLVIREGPPPGDLASDPGLLVQLARANAATVVVVDSLKDAAVKLTDDETGGRVNRAIQLAIAEGIEVLVLHHQRKGQGGEKPKKLEDVYGSVWITAGMGSVILLWGAAGDPIVELVHLKQPADEVGPLKIEHDHAIGQSTIHRGFDLLRYLRLNPNGVTSRQVAVALTEKAQPSESDIKKAKRKLDAAVKRGVAAYQEPAAGGPGGSTPARYYPAEQRQEPTP